MSKLIDITLFNTMLTKVKAYITNEVGKKQDKLVAGSGITIAADGKTISASGSSGGGTSLSDVGKLLSEGLVVELTEESSSVEIENVPIRQGARLAAVHIEGSSSDLSLISKYVNDYEEEESNISRTGASISSSNKFVISGDSDSSGLSTVVVSADDLSGTLKMRIFVL